MVHFDDLLQAAVSADEDRRQGPDHLGSLKLTAASSVSYGQQIGMPYRTVAFVMDPHPKHYEKLKLQGLVDEFDLLNVEISQDKIPSMCRQDLLNRFRKEEVSMIFLVHTLKFQLNQLNDNSNLNKILIFFGLKWQVYKIKKSLD